MKWLLPERRAKVKITSTAVTLNILSTLKAAKIFQQFLKTSLNYRGDVTQC
jgi:hypothetical protein